MTSVSSSMRFRAYLSVKSTSFCLENLLSVDGLTYSSHSSSRKSSQLRLMYPGSVVQTWRSERSTYRMTVSTFCRLVSPHLSANSSYSSRKSSIGCSISPEKCGASLDRADGIAATSVVVVSESRQCRGVVGGSVLKGVAVGRSALKDEVVERL